MLNLTMPYTLHHHHHPHHHYHSYHHHQLLWLGACAWRLHIALQVTVCLHSFTDDCACCTHSHTHTRHCYWRCCLHCSEAFSVFCFLTHVCCWL